MLPASLLCKIVSKSKMKYIPTILLFLLLLSCQNKSRQEYSPTLKKTRSEKSYQQPDTAVTKEVKGQQEEVKVSSTPISSASSRSHESSSYDRSATKGDACQSKNMRGFDPASEDDMDDNGMSRYMDNYDDSGWD